MIIIHGQQYKNIARTNKLTTTRTPNTRIYIKPLLHTNKQTNKQINKNETIEYEKQ